jgi:hypothetical protein
MRTERLLLGLHGTAMLLALVAAFAWPRAGQAAVLVPLGSNDLRSVLHWAKSEQTQLIAFDPASGRAVARISSNHSLLSALGSGILPIAARAATCGSEPAE